MPSGVRARCQGTGKLGAGQGDKLGRGADEGGEASLGVEGQRHVAGLQGKGQGPGSGSRSALLDRDNQALGGKAFVKAQPVGLGTAISDRAPEQI
jgi:hypothetical protein